MKRILLKKDDNAIRQELNHAYSLSRYLEQMLNELQKFEVDLPTGGELSTFTENPEAYVKSKIADELAAENQVKLGKRKQDVNKVIATLDLPSFTTLNELAAKVRSLPARPFGKMVVNNVDGVLTVNTDSEYEAELTEKHSRYAETDEQIELYNDIKAVSDAISNFEAKYLNNSDPGAKFTFRENTPLLYFTMVERKYAEIAQKKGIY